MTNKERFKMNIRMVELEQHSYCNRQCWFCPNQFIDRKKPVEFLDEKVYRQILTDLNSIGYSEIISFSGNCEPFSQLKFLDRIKLASELCPSAFLMTNTNTDYLATEVVNAAADNGLEVLKCQLYFDEDEPYTTNAIQEKMDVLKSKLAGIDFVNPIPNQWYALVGNLIVHAYSKDWKKQGHNRCDVQVRPTTPRMSTCYEPVQYIGVNYDRYVTPCCNIRPDYKPYDKLILGRIDDTPGALFEMYQGVLLPETEYPCGTCMGKDWHPNGKLVYQSILQELKRE
jgi:hypothetical protein